MRRMKTAAGLLVAVLMAGAGMARAAEGGGVTVKDVGDKYVLSNGIVTATISKTDGNLWSLEYNGIQTLDPNPKHPSGYWSHSAFTPEGKRTTAKVTIDPSTNGGERAEVSVKGISNGERMGAGPGGSAVADIEIRWALEKGKTGIYTYTIWTHKPEYPWTSVGEARFCAKLNDDVFDWMTVDAKRNMKMFTAHDWNYGTVMNMKEVRLLNTGEWKGKVEHKYDYSANQFDTPAWGWSSTTKHVGIWFINPSDEYLSGGPTKIELSAHRDATFHPEDKNAPAPPCLLNYWRGSHYGGSSVVVGQGEMWTKVVGPFEIYCNGGKGAETPDSLWKDALAQSKVQSGEWPYGWVEGVDYPHKEQRSTVSGRLVLEDPQATDKELEHLRVGLAYPPYMPPAPSDSAKGERWHPREVTWQDDAKHYEFWVNGDEEGRFSIPNVRAGKYTLYAIADDVLGQFEQADVTVGEGEKIDMGRLVWKPVRYGKQIWEIGKPDRSAGEFRNGAEYNHWGIYNEYAEQFPEDVNFVIGKSDWRKDWNIMEVPHWDGKTIEKPGRKEYEGRATTWTITFDMDHAPTGEATLRVAFAGTEAKKVDVAVNDKPAGEIADLPNTSAIHRDSETSYWQERDVRFDASMLKAGANTIKLTVPAGNTTAGVEYDYLRLEVGE